MRFGGDQQISREGVIAAQARRALADRRMSAREAYWDNRQFAEAAALDEAIETATRVRVTEEIVEAAQNAFPVLRDVDEGRIMLAAAFRAAGFEVVE